MTPAMEFGLTCTVWSVAELTGHARAMPVELDPLPPPPYADRTPYRHQVSQGYRKMR